MMTTAAVGMAAAAVVVVAIEQQFLLPGIRFFFGVVGLADCDV